MNINDTDERTYKRARERVAALRGFYIHAMVYTVVNLGLFTINMVTSPDNLWFYWPLIGWGIGLVINAMVVFAGGVFGSDWEERKIREVMEDERRHQPQRPAA